MNHSEMNGINLYFFVLFALSIEIMRKRDTNYGNCLSSVVLIVHFFGKLLGILLFVLL